MSQRGAEGDSVWARIVIAMASPPVGALGVPALSRALMRLSLLFFGCLAVAFSVCVHRRQSRDLLTLERSLALETDRLDHAL
ncbi:hypothetical protein [Streptomyces sp. OV198]|uniref:hypothetical protein n=1 Tax=Streptomyces sp. OV198 TaxID=1882787 RepID=UPI000BE3CA0C|nr:hypothetical protein [Streptomyces sp. OV198]